MIITVTPNAALDRTLVASGFAIGESRTVERALILGGGKGINVARALQGLGQPVLALGFAGGRTGRLIRAALDAEGLAYDLTAIAAESRTCTAIIDPSSGSATEVNEPGAAVTRREQDAFLDRFDHALGDAQLVALSGSLPPGLQDNFYATLIDRARAAGIPCLLDTSGRALPPGIAAAPLLAKPNQHEAAILLGGAFDPEDGAFVAYAMPSPGPAVLCLTLGADGAVLHTPAGSWRARPPRLQVLDTVGAGDCFVAGLAAALVRAISGPPGAAATPNAVGATADGSASTRTVAPSAYSRVLAAISEPATLEAMLRLASAVSAASTLTIGAGRCDPADIERLLTQIVLAPLQQ